MLVINFKNLLANLRFKNIIIIIMKNYANLILILNFKLYIDFNNAYLFSQLWMIILLLP